MKKSDFDRYFVKQSLVSDCGPACLAMIAKYHGKNISIEKIKLWTKTDSYGTSGKGMLVASKKLQLIAKSFKIEERFELLELYEEQKAPFIAILNTETSLKHYITVFFVSNLKVIIGDPLTGISVVEINEFFRRFSGIVLCLKPTKSFNTLKEDSNRSIINDIFKNNGKYLFTISIISLGISIFGIANSLYFQYLMNNVSTNNYYSKLKVVTSALVLIIIVKHVLDYFRQSLLLNLSKKIDIPLMCKLYSQVLNLPYSFYSKKLTGDIISRFDDVNLVREAITNIFVNIFLDIAMCITGLYYLNTINSDLFKLCIIPLVIHYLLNNYFKKYTGDSNIEMLTLSGLYKDKLNQAINGYEKIKGFSLQNKILTELDTSFSKLVSSSIKIGNLINLQMTLLQLVNQIFSVLVLFAGVSLVLSGKMTMGNLITYNSLLYYFMTPITHVFSLLPRIRLAKAANKRVMDLLNAEKEELDAGEDLEEINSGCLLEIKDVDYSYNYRNTILSKLNMVINKNSRVAIVGKSGSGKTTFINLLLKYDDPTSGIIKFNGQDIMRLKKRELRKKIVCINQFTFFFKDTIRNNLSLGNPQISDEEMIRICKLVGIFDFINNLPLKFDSVLMENASNLSGGQRQKLAIAQALISMPEVLIFDESTSNLDAMSESVIKNIIENLTNITVIIVSHRLTLTKDCDEIFVLDNGRIVEKGSHEQLINVKGLYSNFWYEQQ